MKVGCTSKEFLCNLILSIENGVNLQYVMIGAYILVSAAIIRRRSLPSSTYRYFRLVRPSKPSTNEVSLSSSFEKCQDNAYIVMKMVQLMRKFQGVPNDSF